MLEKWSSYWFRKRRWIFTGQIPRRLEKSIVVAGPHTSTRDFKVAMGVVTLSGFRPNILVDKEAFKGWKKFVLRRFNAVPFDQQDIPAMKEMIKKTYASSEECSFVFTPLRRGEKSGEWHDLFYDLSLELDLPIVLVGMDNKRKRVKFHTHFYPSIDRERDLNFILRFFNSF